MIDCNTLIIDQLFDYPTDKRLLGTVQYVAKTPTDIKGM